MAQQCRIHSNTGVLAVFDEHDKYCCDCTVEQSRSPEAHYKATWPNSHVALKN
jgi:hypothetical protein